MLSCTLGVMDRWRTFTSSERIEFRWKRSGMELGGVRDDEGGLALVVNLQPQQGFATDLLGEVVSSPTPPTEDSEPVSTKKFTKDRGPPKEIHVKGVRSLPKPDSLAPFAFVTSLFVNNAGWKDMPLHQCVEFLTAFPALASMTLLNRFVQDPDYNPGCPSVAPVLLPHLRSLTLSIASTRCLLSHMTTPALERLQLMYINSSVEYDHPTRVLAGGQRRGGARLLAIAVDGPRDGHGPAQLVWSLCAASARARDGLCGPPHQGLQVGLWRDERTGDLARRRVGYVG